MNIHCNECGRFCAYETLDAYTHFGGALEPPDNVVVCAACAKAAEDRIVTNTKRPARPYIPWRPAAFHYRAVHRLGMVLAGPKRAAWCSAFWPDAVPDDYERWDNPSLEPTDEHTA